MELVHLLRTPVIASKWMLTNRIFPTAPATVLTDCCCCRMRRSDTVSRLLRFSDFPIGGFGSPKDYQWPRKGHPEGYESPVVPTGAYYDPEVVTECAPDRGCKVNPKRKRGASGRRLWAGQY